MESLSGLIERVTFHNEESGFAVLRVKAGGRRDLATVVGQLPSVSAGEWLHAEGHWLHDREHGLQFRAERLQTTAPNTRAGIEKYLGSGLIKGIGPVYAKRLVEKFGEEIFDIIDERSARLEEVEGIGAGRRRKIKAAWDEQKVVREIMVFLHANGVSTSRAVRIYKIYGVQAIATIQANPYVLARDIQGIGFHSADQIARKMGLPFDSLQRAAAGLGHVLMEATGQGHCALPVEDLMEAAGELLTLEEPRLTEALDRALAAGDLVMESLGEQRLIYLPYLKRAEEEVAHRLNLLRQGRPAYPVIDLDKALAWVQEKTGTTLGASQVEAFRQVFASRLVIVTGGPGVGKTTLLNAILKVLVAKRVRCLLGAPTGRAAKRLGEATGREAKTLHRLLEVQGPGKFGRNEDTPLEGDLVVVDEVSMVDLPLMARLLAAMPPRGGLLLVGDIDQLPSVGPGNVLRDVIESRAAPVARLTEVFRQAAGSRIITNAHRINIGHMPEFPEKGEEADFYFIDREEAEDVRATLLDLVGRRLPSRYDLDPVRDIQVLCPMNRGSLGTRDLNVALQETLNPAGSEVPVIDRFGWQFRPGDKVIQTQNDYDKEVFNGDIGRVADIDPVEREVKVRFDGREVTYEFGELDELALAYAITVHKSQGSEFPVVVLPLATQHYLLLQRNLLYTGVTRGRRLVVLVGQKKALGMAVRNQDTRRRFGGLRERIRMLMEG